MRDLPVIQLKLNAPENFGNVAEKLTADQRRTLATDLISLIENVDKSSMSDWLSEAQGYLDDVDAATARAETKSGDEEGSGEKDPPSTELTLTAVIRFAARATAAILGEPDLFKASEPGSEPLASWVSSQLRTEDPHWILDTDPLVVHMAVTGLAWRKRKFDREDKVFHTRFLTCDRVIINKNVRNVERAPRITEDFERYPYEIDRSIERGHWVDYKPVYDMRDPQAPKKFYETDVWLDLDGDDIEEPWTITISRDDHPEIVKIEPRWSKKTIVQSEDVLFFKPVHQFYPYRFLPDPKGEFFPMGFGKLLSRAEASADNLLASIVNTAKTEAENGGIMAGGGFGLPQTVEVKNERITTVNTDGAPLANRFQMFPVRSVSAGSVQVLDKIVTLGDRLAGTLNTLENAPASMSATLARGLIDDGTQVQSAVHRRLVSQMTQEGRQFVRMADAYGALPDNMSSGTAAVAVTADPALATELQRSALAGVYGEMIKEAAAEGVPWNIQECQMRFCAVMRLPDPEKLIGQPKQPEATPDEKLKGMIGLAKVKIDKLKAIGGIAVQLTQALKNLVDANGGMQANQSNLLQMTLLEHTVQQLLTESTDAGSTIDGMAGAPGNQAPPGVSGPAQGGGGNDVPSGAAGGPGDAGAGGGVS